MSLQVRGKRRGVRMYRGRGVAGPGWKVHVGETSVSNQRSFKWPPVGSGVFFCKQWSCKGFGKSCDKITVGGEVVFCFYFLNFQVFSGTVRQPSLGKCALSVLLGLFWSLGLARPLLIMTRGRAGSRGCCGLWADPTPALHWLPSCPPPFSSSSSSPVTTAMGSSRAASLK